MRCRAATSTKASASTARCTICIAYHYFPELERDQVPGGPPTGGTIYLADAFPQEMRGAFIAGNFLGHTVSWWNVTPSGSTVRADYGGVLWDSHDTWCGPTDVCLAPDGSLYVSDFYDQRTAHPDPDANWDRSNGRIYKISAEAAPPSKPIDIGSLSTDAIVDLLTHPNHWYAIRARHRARSTSRSDVERAASHDGDADRRQPTAPWKAFGHCTQSAVSTIALPSSF